MSAPFIQPTIGRIVHFYSDAESGPRPAIVTAVWSEKFVNLAIFKADGNVLQNPPTSIPLIQGDAIRPAACWCEWMPWQVEKAREEDSKIGGLTPDLVVIDEPHEFDPSNNVPQIDR